MGEKYTYNDIFEEAIEIFGIEVFNRASQFDTERKAMQSVLNKKGVEGKERGKKNATTFDRVVVDSLIYDWCFDRWKEKGTNKNVKKRTSILDSKKLIEEEAEKEEEKQRIWASDPISFQANQEIEDRISDQEERVRLLYKEKKQEIMVEAIFNRYFKLNEKKLEDDIRLLASMSIDGDLARIPEIRSQLDDLSEIDKYVIKK